MNKAILLGATLILMACQAPEPKMSESNFKFDQALRVMKTLSSDDMQGRRTGTSGIIKARKYLLQEINTLNVFDDFKTQNFEFLHQEHKASKDNPVSQRIQGTNLIGLIDIEDDNQGPLFVITAHYDHLGVNIGKTYNGADDNASGSAALFAIAESFRNKTPKHDILFVWLDAEEMKLNGARAYIESEERFSNRPIFNLNLDMISQNKDEIYLAGSYHVPALKPLIEQAAKDIDIKVSFGHDSPADKGDDWTFQSDHGEFFKRGIPFAYFGVEDHQHYHAPSDTFESIPLSFYQTSIQLIINSAHILDENLESLAKPINYEISAP